MGTSVQNAGRGRLREFDVLRGVAILLVLGHHMGAVPLHTPAIAVVGLDLWRQAGWVGVDLFFVLSGFLVSGLLFQEYQESGQVALGRFLIRRGFKIYPAFYTLLAVTIIVDHLLLRPAPLRGIVSEALFVQNYGSPLWTHTWSLAVEEQFYLLLAFVVGVTIALAKMRRRAGEPFHFPVPGFVGVAVVALALRCATAWLVPPDVRLELHLAPTHLRLDSLLFGVLLSYLFHFHGARLGQFVGDRRRAIAWLALVCLVPCLIWPVTSVVMQTVGFTLLYLGFGGVLLLSLYRTGPSATTRWSRLVGRPVGVATAMIAWLGVYSYSIYLWHMPVQAWTAIGLARMARWAPSSGLEWALYFVEGIAVGVGMAKLIEGPGLALRNRLVPSRARQHAHRSACVVTESRARNEHAA
jgi:peptidoglycan/LPS O-acetylase OafA/YrhL